MRVNDKNDIENHVPRNARGEMASNNLQDSRMIQDRNEANKEHMESAEKVNDTVVLSCLTQQAQTCKQVVSVFV
jgi:hypothetical protein